MLFKNSTASYLILPRKYKLFNESISCLEPALCSKPTAYFPSNIFHIFKLLPYIFLMLTLSKILIPQPVFKNFIYSSCSSQKPPLHQIFIDPTDSNDPSWHFIEVSPMVEFILHCYVVICEFLVIMVTGTPATRLET